MNVKEHFVIHGVYLLDLNGIFIKWNHEIKSKLLRGKDFFFMLCSFQYISSPDLMLVVVRHFTLTYPVIKCLAGRKISGFKHSIIWCTLQLYTTYTRQCLFHHCIIAFVIYSVFLPCESIMIIAPLSLLMFCCCVSLIPSLMSEPLFNPFDLRPS